MGKDLCEQFPVAIQTFEEASDLLGFDLLKLCCESTIEELTRTSNAQPAILTASISAYRVLQKEVPIQPLMGAGHSLGEFSALVCSGALEFADAVKLVRQRGIFMEEAVSEAGGAMSAVMNVKADVVESVCKQVSSPGAIVVTANYNSMHQTIISGHKSAVMEANRILEEHGAVNSLLQVQAPFHSPLMCKAAEQMESVLNSVVFHDMYWPVISNVDAKPYTDKSLIANLLTEQITSPVRWYRTMEYMNASGIKNVIELGPKTVLKNLYKQSFPQVRGYSMDSKQHCDTLSNLINPKADFIYPEAMRFIKLCMVMAVSTKNRSHDQEKYQQEVVIPYKRIKNIKETFESENKPVSYFYMSEALEMLKSVFMAKEVPINEQKKRFAELFRRTQTQDLFDNVL